MRTFKVVEIKWVLLHFVFNIYGFPTTLCYKNYFRLRFTHFGSHFTPFTLRFIALQTVTTLKRHKPSTLDHTTISMLASSTLDHTTIHVLPRNIFKHGHSHRTCSNPFMFLLLFYDAQARNHSIIEISVLGNLTR